MAKIIQDINIAVKEILNGNIIALPTETVYGLAADALNRDAVMKIFKAKKRPSFNPLIVHLYEIGEMKKYVSEIPPAFIKLYKAFSPGPITFIMKKRNNIPDIVTAGLDTVAVRFPSHPIFREILRLSKRPLAAPSANMFGRISPTTADEVKKELNDKVKFILDGGKCSVGIESTVVDLTKNTPKVLRHGFITVEQIEKILKRKIESVGIKTSDKNKIISPGMLASHYSPVKPLLILRSKLPVNINNNDIFLSFKFHDTGFTFINLKLFAGFKEMAFNMFSLLRKADEMRSDFIIIQKAFNRGLGCAVNERLLKASYGEIYFGENNYKIIKKNI